MHACMQGPEHAHKIKEHVLAMLYTALQGALDRNSLVAEQLKLDYKPGGLLAESCPCQEVAVHGRAELCWVPCSLKGGRSSKQQQQKQILCY